MLKHAAHPGEVLKNELADLRISPTELAHQIDVSANSVSQIIDGKISISGDTALRLGRWFKTEPRFWMKPGKLSVNYGRGWPSRGGEALPG